MKKILLASCFLLISQLTICDALNIPANIKEKYNIKQQSPTPWIKKRADLLRIMPKNKIVAEIGVQAGLFAEEILLYTQPEHLYLIDCWAYQNPTEYHDEANMNNNEQEKLFQSVKQKFRNNPRVTVIRAFSPEAAELFKDNFFDWIYIDANHAYEGVKKDLEGWYPKIKVGGIISGHDYILLETVHSTFGVVSAVNEFMDKYHLKLEYLTNENHHYDSYGIIKK